MKLFDGDSRDIISTNVRGLCSEGMSERQATHLSMKHASSGRRKPRMPKVSAMKPHGYSLHIRRA